MKSTENTGLTIGTLAESSGVGVETIRFYERKGLIKRPARRLTTYRQYSFDDARRVRFIKRAQGLGFTLKEIKEFFALTDGTYSATCGDVRKRAESKLAEIEEKLKDLQRMKRSLKELARACGEGKKALAECRILDCFESDWKGC